MYFIFKCLRHKKKTEKSICVCTGWKDKVVNEK